LDGHTQCNVCGLICRNTIAIAWADVSRVHAAPVYSYNKKLQFKECILQYQGKSSPIDLNLVKKLNAESIEMTKIEFMDLLKTISKNRSNLDQVHSLYYHIYKIQPPDLVSIENNLLKDFDKFNKLYSEIGSAHIPHQFLLFQFLNRYGYKTSASDVLLVDSMIPSPECLQVFKECNWQVFQ
jgi:hypothetical protein